MRILLSIKPEFANKIFDGSKKFEFRRAIFKNRKVSKVVVYASSPVSMVIGEFEIEEVLEMDKDSLWEFTDQDAGISKEYYYNYFDGKEKAYALKVKNPILYPKAKNIKKSFGVAPPQSFVYL